MYEWGYYTLLFDHHMCELGGQENCDFSKTYFNIVASSSSGATKNSLIADVDGDHILLSFEGYAWNMSLAPLLDCTQQSGDGLQSSHGRSSGGARAAEDAFVLKIGRDLPMPTQVASHTQCTFTEVALVDHVSRRCSSSRGDNITEQTRWTRRPHPLQRHPLLSSSSSSCASCRNVTYPNVK